MYQTFHTLFQFGKAAVVGQIGDLGIDAAALRVATGDFDPRIFTQLLKSQGNAVALSVELEDLDVDFLTHFHDLGRMLDTLPGHIGNVQQAVYATQVNKCAVVCQVLDDTLDRHTFLQGFQQSFALFGVRRFHNRAAGNYDVVALLVQLDDLEFQFFAFQVCRLTHGTYIDQRARQESTDSIDINREATFDLAVDNTDNNFFCFMSRFQLFPRFGALGLLTG